MYDATFLDDRRREEDEVANNAGIRRDELGGGMPNVRQVPEVVGHCRGVVPENRQSETNDDERIAEACASPDKMIEDDVPAQPADTTDDANGSDIFAY